MSVPRVISAFVLSMLVIGLGSAGANAAGAPALFIQADTVRGVLQGMTAPACVQNNQFKHNEEIVWRIRVTDARTGKALDSVALKSLVIELSDGQKFPAHYGNHPAENPTDHFWTWGWSVPVSYPTGSFGYKIIATDKKGHTATYEPFKVATSQLTIIADGEPGK